jgi:hypothetical protein
VTDLTKIDKPFGELDRETKIALFTAWVDGAQIELDPRGTICDPMWARTCVYRVAPTKPSIDWSHVAPQFKWMATDQDETTWVHEDKPFCGDCGWDTGNYENVAAFSSFRAGTCDWKDSLVQRPEGV